ncbi:unnamed protein product [Prorocentrum cordatum]|uniref:Uncharacterized protein n=1 Tax=Prorocentrum cordatum TaxID=2364126 RepID=A0ABN9XJL3_9DINO|nr:unnamed protein product [Polarella glacialis]
MLKPDKQSRRQRRVRFTRRQKRFSACWSFSDHFGQMASRIVPVCCFLGAFLQLGASTSAVASVLPDGVVDIAQTDRPSPMEESLFRRMGVDYDGQLNGQHYRDGKHKVWKDRGFSCAEVRAKYGSEKEENYTTEEVLCLDISRARGNASCCQDSPKSCCKNADKCTLDDVFSALDMQDRCSKSALVEPFQVHDPRGDETGDGVADNAAAIKLKDDNMGTASIMVTIDWTAGLAEQKRQVEEKLEAMRDGNLQRSHSQVEDSLLHGRFLTYALEELRRVDLLEQAHTTRTSLFNARSNASRPLYNGHCCPNNLDPNEFGGKVAGGAAGLFMNLVQGKDLETSLQALASSALTIVGLINPALAFFAGIFMSFLGGNSNDALIKAIMTEVDKRIRRDRARTLNLQLKDLVEEVSWMPGMVEKTVPEVGISWWLIVQHDLATKKSLVFHDVSDREEAVDKHHQAKFDGGELRFPAAGHDQRARCRCVA